MFRSAQVPEKPDDDDVVMVGHELTLLRLLYAEDKD
jgi:hypothetical protein